VTLFKQEFEARLARKAAQDDAFRTRLFEDPRSVVAEELAGANVPAGLTINVVQDSDDALTLVLPPASVDIPDQDLATADDVSAQGISICVTFLNRICKDYCGD